MKRKNVLLKDFQAKKMDKGGMLKPFNSTVTAGIGAGATILDGALDGIDPTDRYGTRTGAAAAGSGALKGAAAGAALGPVGLAGGAVIGSAISFFGNKAAQKAKQNTLNGELQDAEIARDTKVNNRLANNPALLYGNADAQLYKYGGTVKGKPATKHYFSRSMPKSVNLAPDLLPTVATSPSKMIKFEEGGQIITRTPAPIDTFVEQRFKFKPEEKAHFKTKYGNTYDNMLLENADLVKKHLNEFRSGASLPSIPSLDDGKRFTQSDNGQQNAGVWNPKTNTWNYAKYKMGGQIKQTSSSTAEVQGKSHADGGVKLPSAGVELEGGETVAGDFVFSKELGFADIHNKLGKRMGSNEKRPATVLNMNTARAMKRKEGFLKIYQEQTKKDQGLANEIDNTAEEIKEVQSIQKMALGGTIQDPPGTKPKMYQYWTPQKKANYEAQQATEKAKLANWAAQPLDPGVISNRTAVNTLGSAVTPAGTVPKDKTFVAVYKGATKNVTPIVMKPKQILSNSKPGGKTPTVKPVIIPEPKLDDRTLAPINPLDTNTKLSSGLKVKFPETEKVDVIDETPTTAQKKDGTKVGDVVNAIAPFASNIANSFRKLPEPPKPKMDETLTPDLINLDADRAESVRQRRGADASAAAGLNGNNQVAAVKAANLVQDVRSQNSINQTEQNTNTQIKNQFQQINAGITRGNNLKSDFYNGQKVERQLKQQELDAANIADVGNKIQLQNRDNRLFEQEDTKSMLTFFSDPTAATSRAIGPVLDRFIKDPKARSEFQARVDEISALDKADRKVASDLLKVQLKAAGVPTDVLNTTKALPADNKVEKQSLQNDYLRSKTDKQKK